MKFEKVSYLNTLRFNKKLLNTFPAKFLANVRIPLLLILLIVIIGTFAFNSIPRRLNPEIKIPIVVISTVLPGAGPDDVEQLVTIPLERQLSGVDGLDILNSTSRDSVSIISMQFLSSVDVKEAVSDVQGLVDRMTNLPEDAMDPNVASIDFENQPFWTFAITGKSDVASLMRFSNELEKAIENIPDVGEVESSGLDDQTIEIQIDLAKSQELHISPFTIQSALKSAATSYPAGLVHSDQSVFSLTINRELSSIEDIRNIKLDQDGTVIRLRDVATVSERSKSGQTNTYIASAGTKAERAVQFFVYKKPNADINVAFETTEPVVQELIKKYDGQFSLYSIMNTSDQIDEQFGDLNREFLNTSILVFVLLLVFLGIRQGFISNVTVPLTFLITFGVIQAFGMTLNFLTVFSLLLTLGILIDDTIVVVAAMTRYYKTGRFTPYETGIMVWNDFVVPLWSSAITTIWGFVPLLLSTGIIGEFIKSIPIVVTTTMIASTLISMVITIPLMIVVLEPKMPSRVKSLLAFLGFVLYLTVIVAMTGKNALMPVVILTALIVMGVTLRSRKALTASWNSFLKKNQQAANLKKKLYYLADHGLINIEVLSERYRDVIENILRSPLLRKRTAVAIGVFTIVAYLLVPFGLVKNEFFPKEDGELLFVGVSLPSGTQAEKIDKEALELTEKLNQTEELDYLVAEAGKMIQSTGDRQNDPSAVLFTLHLTKPEDRKLTSSDIAQKIRESFSDYTKGTFSVVEITGGPPAGADIQIQILGDDLGVLDSYADKVMEYLRTQPGVVNVDKSVKAGTSKIVFVPDRVKIIDNGLSVEAIALSLRTYASGFTLDSILFGTEEEDITFRTNAYDDKTIEQLSSIEIPIQRAPGGSMPLSALGTFKLENNPTVINREDEKRTLSVFAGVTKGVNIPQKNAELLAYANSLDLPAGYEWKTGGVNEENQKSVNSILQAMGLAFLLILVTMVIEFGSFRQAFIAMLMIPISVAGVLYIFALVQTPLSFAALIGVLALFGIVMRHAIVVMEKINENRKHGLNLHDAIADAASSRLEPVLLTSLATIVALIPITISDPFWRGLGGAIIAGLLFTGALKLFIVPVLYFNFYKDEA